ncbi:hypothetical protein ACH5RR_033498 [Cinchona calisaya]|uniref:FLZ-type domain-containing protein n=1 Tax=Cinchona calisaya TaxID=153742 RepID=A0ABD2YL36_9GENT
MVGLSVVLEEYKDMIISGKKSVLHQHHHQHVIRKSSTMIKPSPPPPPPSPFSSRGFLDYCFLCKQKLLPGKDIFMYKGDMAFCSEECRCRQIFIDEEETIKPKTDHCSSSSRKGAKKRANGFAY